MGLTAGNLTAFKLGALGCVTCLALSNFAQPMPAFEVSESASIEPKANGFSIKKEDEKIHEALVDFARYRDKKVWDRAFKAFTTASESITVNGMSPQGDGFYVPTREVLFRSLISLPPAGRDAYRLFNEAKARQLFDALLDKNGSESIADLCALVDRYFITPVGPQATDRLGDAYFEAGEFMSAARMWGRIINAETQLSAGEAPSPLRTRFKRAVALARAHHADAFAAAEEDLAARFPDARVEVGGHEIDANQYLRSLEPAASDVATKRLSTTPSTRSSAPVAATQPIDSIDNGNLAWRFPFIDDGMLDTMLGLVMNNGWGNMAAEYAKMVPAVTVDSRHVYINWAGVIFAVDLRTGKLIWRNQPFSLLVEKFMEFVQTQPGADRFAVSVGNGRLYAVTLLLDRLNQNEPFRLFCLDPDTGKKIWGTDSGALTGWGFIGAPLIVDNLIYITAHPRESQEISLLAIDAVDGHLQWILSLGMPQVNTNNRGMPIYPIPQMLHRAGTLYILTDNGGLLAIDTKARTMEWAFKYEIPATANNQRIFYYYAISDPPNAPGSLLMYDGVLYFKERAMRTLFAIDPVTPSLKWRRSVDSDAAVVGVDEQHIHLMGSAFSTIDRRSQRMLHSYSADLQTDALMVTQAGERYLALTGRGLRAFDAAGGEPQTLVRSPKTGKWGDYGGLVLRSGDRLIAVSNLSVTAYRIAPIDRPVGQVEIKH